MALTVTSISKLFLHLVTSTEVSSKERSGLYSEKIQA